MWNIHSLFVWTWHFQRYGGFSERFQFRPKTLEFTTLIRCFYYKLAPKTIFEFAIQCFYLPNIRSEHIDVHGCLMLRSRILFVLVYSAFSGFYGARFHLLFWVNGDTCCHIVNLCMITSSVPRRIRFWNRLNWYAVTCSGRLDSVFSFWVRVYLTFARGKFSALSYSAVVPCYFCCNSFVYIV